MPEDQRARVVRCIRALPSGMVSSYGAIARAANWAGAARQVVRILQQVPGLPWHRVVGSEGQRGGRWVLLDFGDVVVHVFHQEERGHYDLEGLWADAPRIQVDA